MPKNKKLNKPKKVNSTVNARVEIPIIKVIVPMIDILNFRRPVLAIT